MIEQEAKKKLLMHEAQRWVGVKEIGNNAGQIVEMFQHSVNSKPSGEPWCAAFVEFCLKEIDALWLCLNGSVTYSPLPKTESSQLLFNNSQIFCKLEKPEPGCIVVWTHYTADGKNTGTGHVGIVLEVHDDNSIKTCEGNTSDGLGINREGDGVYIRNRTLTNQGTMRVLGFLNPWP